MSIYHRLISIPDKIRDLLTTKNGVVFWGILTLVISFKFNIISKQKMSTINDNNSHCSI